MDRCALTLTSGGRLIVKGDLDSVVARLMGNRGGLIMMVRLSRDGHSTTFIEKPVVVNVEHVTCAYSVEGAVS